MKPKIDSASLENPFQKILAKECLNWFNHSRLITLFHINPMSADEKFNAYVAFKKSNMHMKEYGLKTLKMALDGTKYEAFTHNYVSHNMILFSPEPNIKQVLKLSKKFPQIDHHDIFMTPDDFLRSMTPGIKQPEGQSINLLTNILYYIF